MPPENKYVILSDECSLRMLENPCVYNKSTDELYEVDGEGFEFLRACDGSRRLSELDGVPEFVEYCFSEGILRTLHDPHVKHHNINRPADRSLRYLELHLTHRCNLRCKHCYLRAGDGPDLDLLKVFKVIDEFDALQGLRLLLSGGEPLMHKGFWYINERLPGFGFRSVLLTNGTMVGRDVARKLKVHEAQVSLDGMARTHDMLRGMGSFELAVAGMRHLLDAGKEVSVATTVNAVNVSEIMELGRFLEDMGVKEWNVDMPSAVGRFNDNPDLHISPTEAAPFMSQGFGGSHHGGADGFACGPHLCAVGVDGQVAKCGFYLDSPVGSVTEGLGECWGRIKPVPLAKLDCDCEHIDSCMGGCRFRAASFGGELGPDPVKCHNLGVLDLLPEGGDVHDHCKGG